LVAHETHLIAGTDKRGVVLPTRTYTMSIFPQGARNSGQSSALGLLLILAGSACSSSESKGSSEGPLADETAADASGESAPSSSASGPDASHVTVTLSDAGVPVIEVPTDAAICNTALPFKPTGCGCKLGESASCWTGATGDRNRGDCKDGTQNCMGTGEFATWGACEGQVLDCGEPPPPSEFCPCVPGATIGCDEDCSALVFCAPFSTKVCQPDGTWGPCRESLLPQADATASACLNVFFGCFGENVDGVYAGICDDKFQCGHAPTGGNPKPPITVTSTDGGVPGDTTVK